MKSTLIGFFLIFCLFNSSYKFVYAQDGLEGIILEKFYISTKEDNSKPELSGHLASGSITYRIYVDLISIKILCNFKTKAYKLS